jgi:hypothetical protein
MAAILVTRSNISDVERIIEESLSIDDYETEKLHLCRDQELVEDHLIHCHATQTVTKVHYY